MPSSTDALPEAPFSPELLADLHADALPEGVSSRLWPVVRRDEESMKVLASLDAVSALLRDVGQDSAGTMPIPAEVVELTDRTIYAIEMSLPVHGPAVDTEAAGSHPAGSHPAGSTVVPFRARPRRHVILGIAAAAAVLAVASATFAAVWHNPTEPDSIAADPSAEPGSSLVLDSADLDSGLALTIIGKRDPGSLADPVDLAACLESNGLDPASSVLGSSQVRVDGRNGTLLVIAGAQPSQFVALAVGSNCGSGNPDILTRRDIG